MNPKNIEAFRAVMLSGSMTIAARDIHTTQPNVSRMIAHLEHELQMSLFERVGNKLHPTDEAIAFFKEVERYYLGLKTLRETAHNIKRFGSGRLRIATAPALGMGFISGVVRRFSDASPGVTVSVRTNNSATIEQLISSQLCDLAFAVYAGGGNSNDVKTEKLVDARGVCVLPPGHRLESHVMIEARDLEGEAFVSLSHHDGLRERIDALFEHENIMRTMLVETEFLSTVCCMVKDGLGVSIVNPLVAKDYIAGGLTIKPFSPRVDFPVYMLSPRHRPDSVLASRFADIVRTTLTQDLLAFAANSQA
ncbi:LysR family transcriptional regulator [Alcaligenaceae bacterium]|nr:LysR family transcriptional regulator [Alcaligenaceae bacterium]